MVTLLMASSDSQRKPTKNTSHKKKKVPRRGMGVERLERLRLQERWKKMTDINEINSLQLNINNNNIPHLPSFNYLLPAVPMQHAGAPGFSPGPSPSSVSVTGFRKDFGFTGGLFGPSESNTEVSSMPNQCGSCFKKKCTDELNGERAKFLKVSPVIAVHLNANPNLGVFMEYEFFPEKRESCAGVVADQSGGEASPTSPASAITHQAAYPSSSDPNSVDLSLKL